MKQLVGACIALVIIVALGYFQHTRVLALEADLEQAQADAALEHRRLEIFCQFKPLYITVEDSRGARADVAKALIARAELCSQDRASHLLGQFRNDAELLYKTDDKAEFKLASSSLMLEMSAIARIGLR